MPAINETNFIWFTCLTLMQLLITLDGFMPPSAMESIPNIVNEGFFISIITKIETLGLGTNCI